MPYVPETFPITLRQGTPLRVALDELATEVGLTAPQQHLLIHIAAGQPHAMIADHIGTMDDSVKKVAARTMQHLRVRSRAEIEAAAERAVARAGEGASVNDLKEFLRDRLL